MSLDTVLDGTDRSSIDFRIERDAAEELIYLRDTRMVVCSGELQRFYGDDFGIPGRSRAPSIKHDLNQHAIPMARTLL